MKRHTVRSGIVAVEREIHEQKRWCPREFSPLGATFVVEASAAPSS
jgi:hypothetical protein